MIVYGALLVVIAVTLVFYFLFKERILWWEFFVPIAAVTIVIFVTKLIINHSAVTFTEYWGETIVSVIEEEPYNYWQTEICSESYPCGTDANGNTEYCTRYYDCSHQVDVGPSWGCLTDQNNSYNITEKQHDKIIALFATGKKITGTRTNHDSNDIGVWCKGTKFEGQKVGQSSFVYKTIWGKTDSTRKGIFTRHSYENRVKASDLSLFNISVVSEKVADSLGLFDYPTVDDCIEYPTILGKDIPQHSQELFKRLNAKFGPSNKLRLWVLVFDDKPASIATMQENYWVNGNKNELVICIGRKGEEIQWAHSFSWSLSGDLTAEVTQKALDLYTVDIKTEDGKNMCLALPINVRTLFKDSIGIDTSLLQTIIPLNLQASGVLNVTKSQTPVLNEKTLEVYHEYLNENLGRFQKRSFDEFDYLTVEPKLWQVIFIYVLALIISVGVNLWTIRNEFF